MNQSCRIAAASRIWTPNAGAFDAWDSLSGREGTVMDDELSTKYGIGKVGSRTVMPPDDVLGIASSGVVIFALRSRGLSCLENNIFA